MQLVESRSTERHRADAGFTIVEVLVSMLIISVMALGVAELFAVSIKATHAARNQTSTAVMASQKMEQLRGLTWGYDEASGLPLTDTTSDLAQDPPTNGGSGLNPSPTGTLSSNVAGHVDYLDARSQWVGTGTTPPATAVYIRRWNIAPLPTNPNNTLILQVLVTTVTREAAVGAAGPSTGPRQRLANDALIVSVKTRKSR